MDPQSSVVPPAEAGGLRPMAAAAGRWLRAFPAAVEPLWVCGLLLLQVVWAGAALPLSGKRWEWAQYLLLGLLFPALLAAAGLAGRLLRRWPRPLALLKAGLGAGCLLLAYAYLPHDALEHVKPVWLFFVGTLLALWVVSPACRPGTGPTYILAGLVASGVAWIALSGWLVSPPPFFTSIWQFGVIGLALLLSLCNLLRPADPGRGPAALGRVADLAAVVIITLLAFGWEKPCDATAWHHWGALVGPAEMVRQGGWLLWDTPSQYGFLCPLTLACFPTENAYQALYLLNGSLIALVGAFLFFLFRSAQPGWLNYAFALAVALAALLTVQLTWFIAPTNGPIRYFWCYALLALLWAAARRPDRDAPPERLLLAGGCVVWLLGCLWSFESAANATVIWIPGFAALGLRRCLGLRRAGASRLKAAGAAAGWLALPPALLGSAVFGVWAYYRLRLGHAPDWSLFAEHSLAFSGGFGAYLIDSYGAVWIPVLVFGAVATVLAACAAPGARLAELAAAAGALGMVWAPASYFITRGNDGVVVQMIPMMLAALGVSLHLISRVKPPAEVALLVQMSLASLLVMVFAAAVTKFDGPHGPASLGPLSRLPTFHIERYMPAMDASMSGLLERAGVRDDDPFVFFDAGDMLNPLRFHPDAAGRAVARRHPAWLPIPSPVVLIPLPAARAPLYVDRYLGRHADAAGWLLRRKGTINGSEPEALLMRRLEQSHHATRSFGDATWELEWYEPK